MSAADLVLSADELAALTDRRRSDAQARELVHMRIPYNVRSDGSLVVLRLVVEQLLGANRAGVTIRRPEPRVLP